MKINKRNFKLFSVMGLCLMLLLIVVFPLLAQEKGVLKIGVKSEPDNTNPLIAISSAFDSIIDKNVYNYLIIKDKDLKPVGGLAESWTISEDGLVWTFKLKEGIKWFDGEDFTADDVVWTYSTLINGEYPQSIQLAGVTTCEKVDEYTVNLTTEAPKANMEYVGIPIMPEHIYSKIPVEELDTFSEENPVGTGPFELVEWKRGEFLRFKANPDYYASTPHIDEIVYVVFANTDTLMQALIAGEVDAITDVAQSQFKTLESYPNIKGVKASGMNFTELGFNCWENPISKGNPLVLDPKIRLACDYAIDKQTLVDISLGGFGTPGTSLIPPSIGDWHWSPEEDELHRYDPAIAKQILEDAGYTDTNGDGIREDTDGNMLSFRFAVLTKYDYYVKSASIIQKNLQDIGIKTIISTMDTGALCDLIYKQDFNTDMYLWRWSAEYDPTLKLSVLLTGQIGNRSDCFWSNKTYDALFLKQASQINREERIATVHEMQKIAYEEAPYIILFYIDALEAYRTDQFEGWTKVPTDNGCVVDQVNNKNSTRLNIRLK